MIYDFHSKASVIYHLNFNTVFKQCGDPAPGQVLPFHEGFHADDQEASGRSQPDNVRQRWRFNKYIDEIQPNLDKMKVVF